MGPADTRPLIQPVDAQKRARHLITDVLIIDMLSPLQQPTLAGTSP